MTLGQQKELLQKRTCQAKKAKCADAHQRKKCEVGGGTLVETRSEAIIADEDSEVKVMVDQLLPQKGANNGFADEFICKICLVHVVGCKPMLARCTHLFCGDCIDQWFKVQPGSKTWAQRVESAGSVPCPVCKEPLREEQDLHPISCDSEGGCKMLHRMLSGTRIVCANNPKCSPNGNCLWTGDYDSYQDHVRLCKNVRIPDDVATAPAAQITRLEKQTHACSMEDATPLDAESSRSDSDPQKRYALETQSSLEIVAALSTSEETFGEVQNECLTELTLAASQWTGLVGALLEKARPSTETEDTCSTQASEPLESLEPSDAELSPSSDDHAEDQEKVKQLTAQWQVAQYHQAARYQAAQYHAAQYQAAQYQMAQYQAAQYQMAQLRLAQAAYAAEAAQMQANEAIQWHRAQAASHRMARN